MRLAIALVLVLAACTDESSSSSGPGVTTHVLSLEFPASMGATCLEKELFDVDPNTPGPQYDCSVSQVVIATQAETLIPQCNNLTSPVSSTNKPCWAIELDTANCTSATHEKLAIERTDPAPGDSNIKAQCVTP